MSYGLKVAPLTLDVTAINCKEKRRVKVKNRERERDRETEIDRRDGRSVRAIKKDSKDRTIPSHKERQKGKLYKCSFLAPQSFFSVIIGLFHNCFSSHHH